MTQRQRDILRITLAYDSFRTQPSAINAAILHRALTLAWRTNASHNV